LLLVGLASHAASQQVAGPTAIESVVNGVPITVHATSRLTVKSVGDHVVVSARILADLVDLQRKFASVVDSFAPPADRCANRRRNNKSPTAVLRSGSLWPRGDHLVVSMRGHIDVWSCIPGPEKSAIRWRKKKVAFFDVKLPKVVTWRNMIKKKVGSQPFRGTLEIALREDHTETISLNGGGANMIPEGPERVATEEDLQDAARDIGHRVSGVLLHAIEPTKLKQALPVELRELNMTVVSTRFRSFGGHAIAEVRLDARVPESFGTQRLQQLTERLAN